MTELITVSLADDHPIVLRGLAEVLANEPDFVVVSSSRDGDEALIAIRNHRPRIAVIDIQMPSIDGLQVLTRLKEEALPTRGVLLTAGLTDAQLFDALVAGAAGIVLKDLVEAALIECLREVAQGKQWFAPTLVGPALAREARRRQKWRRLSPTLTPRETEIIHYVAQGRSNKNIAHKISISEGTLKLHLNHIFRKLEVSSRSELVELAFAQGGVGISS
jgi:DNA-binding NarL/FixJ family response regulator